MHKYYLDTPFGCIDYILLLNFHSNLRNIDLRQESQMQLVFLPGFCFGCHYHHKFHCRWTNFQSNCPISNSLKKWQKYVLSNIVSKEFSQLLLKFCQTFIRATFSIRTCCNIAALCYCCIAYTICTTMLCTCPVSSIFKLRASTTICTAVSPVCWPVKPFTIN